MARHRLRRRYGRAHQSLGYRGYEYRVDGAGETWTAEIYKATIKHGMVLEHTVHATSRKAAINKANAIIDAMRGD